MKYFDKNDMKLVGVYGGLLQTFFNGEDNQPFMQMAIEMQVALQIPLHPQATVAELLEKVKEITLTILPFRFDVEGETDTSILDERFKECVASVVEMQDMVDNMTNITNHVDSMEESEKETLSNAIDKLSPDDYITIASQHDTLEGNYEAINALVLDIASKKVVH